MSKDGKRYRMAKSCHKVGVAILIPDKTEFKTNVTIKNFIIKVPCIRHK